MADSLLPVPSPRAGRRPAAAVGAVGGVVWVALIVLVAGVRVVGRQVERRP